MIRFDILPRLLPDRYCDTLQGALDEVARRKMSPVAGDAVTRFDKLPYGTYQVYTVSLRVAFDMIADGADLRLFLGHPLPHTGPGRREAMGRPTNYDAL